MIHSVNRVNEKYYSQALSEKCKFERKKIENIINDDLSLIFFDESDNESDNISDSESDND